ncbi:MAG TPA: hypothetical protein VG122_11750, partial [Gemmata sp.]|nr:hypothetical protein [Gemmata sp.]
KREEKPRFKGVELYSWKDKADDWVFVLLNGTNTLKKEEQVKEAKGQIKGADELKKALALLAVGEQIAWTHRVKGFEFPSEATRKEIKKAAKEAKIVLRIAGDEEE